jgi:hypothetical protein
MLSPDTKKLRQRHGGAQKASLLSYFVGAHAKLYNAHVIHPQTKTSRRRTAQDRTSLPEWNQSYEWVINFLFLPLKHQTRHHLIITRRGNKLR